MFNPKLSVTIRCAKLSQPMSDSFYINGSMPSHGKVPYHKTFTRIIRDKVGIFAVSDAFGNPSNTPFAAFKTLSILKKYQKKFSDLPTQEQPRLIDKYIDETNGIINSLDAAGPGGSVGTSVAMLVMNNGTVYCANVGNVRAYSYKNSMLSRLSSDDTEAERLLSMGAIRKDELAQHPSKELLTNYLGISDSGMPAKTHFSAPCTYEKNDVYLLCTNGLTDFLSEDRISYILSIKASDERIVQRLISEAVARGAQDNITVVLVRVGGNGLPIKFKVGYFKAFLSLIAAGLIVFLLIKFILLIKPKPTPPPPAPSASPAAQSQSTPEPEMILKDE